jgi:hypothetical protein
VSWVVLLCILYVLVAGAIWADDKSSWSSFAVGLLWPLLVVLMLLDLVLEEWD